ncbi:MAG TPA: calcineurin-like phosphoesterase C-terminal domain-containing protein [Xanthomonadaceae bacterium]|nr:calcineurin-like phosphoesterase C-terminal domain-containing protein [Xanthomonadaceae bacterium]
MWMQRFLIAALLTFAATAQGEVAVGTVFLDANGNGVRDSDERGVAGVLVSNGVEVVATDRDGRWRLRVEAGQTLFVIKPTGYRFPSGENGLPRFWRHYLPEGSRLLAFGGIAATGELPESIDFPLHGKDRLDAVRIAVVADPQPSDAADVEYFRRGTMPGLRGEENVALGLLLGDLVNDDLDLYGPLIEALGEVDFPWFTLPGNHDLDMDAGDDRASLDTYRARFGPDTYALQVGRVHVLMLDNVIAEFRDGRFSGYVGGLREDQFRFVQNWIAHVPRQQRIVVAGHIPMSVQGGSETFRAADRERLYRLLQGRPLTILAGHAHQQRVAWHGPGEGWNDEPAMEWTVGAASGSFWSGMPDAEGIPHALMADGTPRGYGLLDVDDSHVMPTWRAAGRRVDEAMRVHAPRVLRHGSYPSAQLRVNVYLGEAGTEVRFRVGDGDWQPMRAAPIADPAVLAINVRQDEAAMLPEGGRVPDAVPSTHLWRAPLPTDLAPGNHRVDVEVRDRWGRIWRESTSYRLQASP